jgi:AAA domain-containing protein
MTSTDTSTGTVGRPNHETASPEVSPGRRLAVVEDGAPAWRPELWSAQRLMGTEFAPPRWAVPGFLCEGVNLFAGPPKVGKSWLALALALAVAAGGRAFGTIPVRRGPVLYLALEDTPRRLQSRMGKLLGDDAAPPGLDIATEWPTLPAGGDVAIATWLDAHPDARMVVLDVFAKVRGPVPTGMAPYDADYAAVTRAKRVADNYGVALLVVHHVRKAGSEDFLQEVSGTNGIAGAADATLVLKRPRGAADGMLFLTGRDVEEAEHALAFDPETGHWRTLDARPVDEYGLGETRAAILATLRASRAPLGPKAIAEASGIDYANVKKTCQRMSDAGQITPGTGGRYTAPAPGSVTLPGLPGDAHGGDVPAVPGVPESL